MPTSVTARGQVPVAGTIAFALGVLLTTERMDQPWGDLADILTFAVPLVLALLAIRARGTEPVRAPAPEASALCVVAFLFAAGTIVRFAAAIGVGSAVAHAGSLTWMSAALAAFGLALGFARGSAAVIFLATITAGVSFLAACTWIFDTGARADRWLLFALVVAYLAASRATTATWPRLAALQETAAGLALVVIGLSFGDSSGVSLDSLGNPIGHASPSWWWMLVVLAGGLALVGAAWHRNAPGTAWAAALVLGVFVADASAPRPGSTVIGWPLLLVVMGALILWAVVWGPVASIGRRIAENGSSAAAGVLGLGLGIELMLTRMGPEWGRWPSFLIGAAATIIVVGFVVAERSAGVNTPAGTILYGVAMALFAQPALRAPSIVAPGHHATAIGTVTWELAILTLVAFGLAWGRRSSALALIGLVLSAVFVLVFANWAFGTDRPSTLRWIALGVALVQLALAVRAARRSPRLSAVAVVAAAVTLTAIAYELLIIGLLSGIGDDTTAMFGRPALGWELVMLAAALGFGALAVALREPSPAYAAAVLGAAFLLVDLLRAGDQVHSLVAWPLLLLVVGGLAAATGARRAEGRDAPAVQA